MFCVAAGRSRRPHTKRSKSAAKRLHFGIIRGKAYDRFADEFKGIVDLKDSAVGNAVDRAGVSADRRGDIRELNMSVDDALKYIISLGMVSPDDTPNTLPENK